MATTDRLFPEERVDRILALVQTQGRASVAELSERFGVSAVTIRGDLALLEQQGLLVRTHGGAVGRPASGTELGFALRRESHADEKARIGRAAAALVRDGDAIALDASTTALQVARHLKDRRELTVVTNGLFIALEFVDCPGVTVVMPGGTFRPASASLVGGDSSSILDRYHIQKGFFGASGFTLDEGLTDVSQPEVELKRRMVARTREVIAVVDGSKWGRVTFAPFASLDQLTRVISDRAAVPEMVAAMRGRGIAVDLV